MRPLNILEHLQVSFRAKVFIIVFTVLALMTASFAGLSAYNEIVSHTDSLIENGYILAKLLAHNSRLGIFAEDNGLLKEPVAGVLRQKDVTTAAIFTMEGKPLYQETSIAKVGRAAYKIDPVAVKKALAIVEQSMAPYYSDNSDYLEFWAPIISGQSLFTGNEANTLKAPPKRKDRLIGIIRLEIDKVQLQRDIISIILKNLALGALFILLSMSIAYIILNRLLNPLRTLSNAVAILGTKGTTERIPIKTRDEIGRLSGTFNAMLDDLTKRASDQQEIEVALRQAQKMEAVGQLAGGIAHDFNNMLTAIISYASVLQMKMQAEDPLKRNVDRLLGVTDRAVALTQGLLAFSRKQPLSLQPINLNQTIKALEHLLLRVIRADIELKTDLTSKEPVIMSNSGQIEQILMNLVTNARDAMSGGGLVKIETEVIELDQAFVSKHHGAGGPGEYAALSVADSGSGMDSETASKIFEPFFTTKEVGKGTGLGLSIVYNIVKQNKGIIDVSSQPGIGTTFRIYFPLIRSTAVEKEPIMIETSKRGTETILLAEDDADVRDVTKGFLEEFGYTVITASDGEDAINRFMQNKGRIDMLITDIVMPGKNGKEVYQRISAEKPEIKVIFTSGYAADIMTTRGLIDENLPFISKPVSPTMFLRKVREVLDTTNEMTTDNQDLRDSTSQKIRGEHIL